MADQLFQVDAFTEHPFRGNPAAVCLLKDIRSTEWMQSLAAEMNLSETAFLLPEGDGWRLRWFTPTQEVDLCGHATLASSKVIFEVETERRRQPLTFFTRSGTLTARWLNGKIELDFPAMTWQPYSEINAGLIAALQFSPRNAVCSGSYCLFEAENEKIIRQLKPNIPALRTLPMSDIIVTARSGTPPYDFVSRFFAPQLGIDEDPVTGSAHCLLGPYWAEKLGKKTLLAYQASARGGVLGLSVTTRRVYITGAACLIFKGTLSEDL